MIIDQLSSYMPPSVVWTVRGGAVERVGRGRLPATGTPQTPPTRRRPTSSRARTPCTPTQAKHSSTRQTDHTPRYPVHKPINLMLVDILFIPDNLTFCYSADVTLADSCVDSLVSCAETLVSLNCTFSCSLIELSFRLVTVIRTWRLVQRLSETKTKPSSSQTTIWTTPTLQLTLTR